MARKAVSGSRRRDGAEDVRVLAQNGRVVAALFVKVGHVFLDAHEKVVVEKPHQVDLGRILGGLGDGHVKGPRRPRCPADRRPPRLWV